MKKFLAMLLALVMALSLVACGEKKDDTKTEGGDTATGSVYYLNFKPESDDAWKALAATYTEKTGVPVKILTAASGEYESTLVSEMDKEDAPTLFQCNEGGVAQSKAVLFFILVAAIGLIQLRATRKKEVQQ